MDFKNGIITIDRAVTIKPQYNMDGTKGERKSVVETTKTVAGIRKIKMCKQLTETLNEWKAMRRTQKPALVKESAFVFATENGELRTYNGFRTTYRRFLAKHGLDNAELNLHRFRHTFATMMLERGVNPRVVQEMLGHEDIETTLGTYSHVLPEVHDSVADVLDDIYEDTVSGDYSPAIVMG